jgi:hypothetical protein
MADVLATDSAEAAAADVRTVLLDAGAPGEGLMRYLERVSALQQPGTCVRVSSPSHERARL